MTIEYPAKEVDPMLTAIQVRNVKPKEKAYKLNDGEGLLLHISHQRQKNVALPGEKSI